jgi:RNA polymerase sigma factor (sigma-70 family)
MNKNELNTLTDKQIIDYLIIGNNQVTNFFFYEKCSSMFGYIICQIFSYKISKDELVNEFYIYLSENNWDKVKHFNYQSKFTTWLSVVGTRYFQKKRTELIENKSSEALIIERTENFEIEIHQRLDTEKILNNLANDRYRFVIQELILKERTPQDVANEMQITTDNLYNIKRRALQQLIQMQNKYHLIDLMNK